MTIRKTLAVALTALTLGSAALASTEASAHGIGGFFHGPWGWHHQHWWPYHFHGGYGGCWRWYFVPGVGPVKKNICWIY